MGQWGIMLRDDIVPHAVRFYTGEANPDEEDEDDSDEDEDEEEETESDESDDDEDDAESPKIFAKKGA